MMHSHQAVIVADQMKRKRNSLKNIIFVRTLFSTSLTTTGQQGEEPID